MIGVPLFCVSSLLCISHERCDSDVAIGRPSLLECMYSFFGLPIGNILLTLEVCSVLLFCGAIVVSQQVSLDISLTCFADSMEGSLPPYISPKCHSQLVHIWCL